MNSSGVGLGFFGIFLVIILLFVPIFGKSSKDLVVTLYEVDERNSVQQILESSPNTDVILEDIKRIRLECNAPFPVQWIYTGNGIPVLSSTIRKESGQKFTASAFITSLKESHTGRYDCISTESSQLASAYFFLYVPGENVFTILLDGRQNEEKRQIMIPKNDSKILIPCAVSNPQIQIVLEKSAGDVLVSIKSIGKTTVYTFDPKMGFILDLRQIQNPEATYVCTALEKGKTKTIEFDVSFPKGGISDFTMATPEPPGDKNGLFPCSTHTDCQPNWSCYTDLFCRDPCLHSIRCGRDAICKYNDRRPYCECPRDFTGDPMKECFNTVQGSDTGIQNHPREPDREPSTTKPTTGIQCKINEHCRTTHICLNGNCVDACAVKICDSNAYCITDANRVAMCLCNPGFMSQNGRDCFPAKFQVEPPNRMEQSAARRPNSATAISSPCVHNRDCPGNTICRTNNPSLGQSCVEFCDSRLCGENAFCQNNFCRCRPNFSGDPFVLCAADQRNVNPAQNKNETSDCAINDDCPRTQKCQSFNTHRKCIDACVGTQCPYNTECQARGHAPNCICPRGFTGSALLGCTKDVETSASTRQLHVAENLRIGERFEVTTQSVTVNSDCSKAGLNCGSNSECRIINEVTTCFCQPNSVGVPPKCRQECALNVDCPLGKACFQNRCRNPCRNKCGKNTRCEVSTGPARAHNCSCLEGFEGHPEAITGCTPIRYHK